MIKGCTFDNQYVSSRTDGGLYESIFPGDGKVWGCSMSVTSSTLTIQPGELMVGGRILLVDGATQIDISNPIADGYGQIVLTIDLSKTSSTETFEQVELSVVYSATDVFPALTKGKINSQNGDMVYQAEMAVVSIAGGNVTGIVSQIADVLGGTWYQDKITALEGSMADTEEKVSTLSNPNLLINGGFAVWQRGESFTIPRTGYGAGKYTADRWRVWANPDSTGGNITVTKAADGMHVESDGGALMSYRFEAADVEALSGKTLTLSLSRNGAVSVIPVTLSGNAFSITLLYGAGTTTINWIKLEVGEEATPYVPKGYGEELLACMRYYQVTGAAFCAGYLTAQTASCTYTLPVPMRTTPTIAGGVDQVTVRPIGADPIYDQTATLLSSSSSGSAIYLQVPAPGAATQNQPCTVQFSGITLNAEMG